MSANQFFEFIHENGGDGHLFVLYDLSLFGFGMQHPHLIRETHDTARAKGQKLIQIFSDEWIHKRKIVESLIMSKLGKSPYVVFARKCTVERLSFKEGTQFFIDNHLQGKDSSSCYYALKFKGAVVA